MYNVSEDEIKLNFLLLPETEFNPFITETAIYDAHTTCVACAAPALEDSNDVIRFNKKTSKDMAKAFMSLWKKYKRSNP